MKTDLTTFRKKVTKISKAKIVAEYDGQHAKKKSLKVLVEVQTSDWSERSRITDAVKKVADVDGQLDRWAWATSTKPKRLWTAADRQKRKDAAAKEKKRVEDNKQKQVRTAKIKVIQMIEVYRFTGTHWSTRGNKGQTYILTCKNKWTNRTAWLHIDNQGKIRHHKRRRPNMDQLEACSPLEFTLATGTSFAKVLRNTFDLELIVEKKKEVNDIDSDRVPQTADNSVSESPSR